MTYTTLLKRMWFALGSLKNRKPFMTSLSFNSAAQLEELSKREGKPKARVIDKAIQEMYDNRKDEVDMELEHKCTVITIATNKGGAGKTTSAAAIADILSRRGSRVLLIDGDPQGNLSKRFGYMPTVSELRDNYLGELIRDRMGKTGGNREIGYYINSCNDYPRIDIIVSDLRLDGDYSIMNAENIKGTVVFRNIIREVREMDVYDYVLIDTRPSLANEVGAIFVASDYIMIPVEPTEDAILGADATIQFTSSCRMMNPDLQVLGIFMTKVYDRNKSFREAAPVIRESWEDDVFQTLIPRSQDADNAGNGGKPVTSMFANKRLAKRYEQLVEEMVGRITAFEQEGVKAHA